LENGYSVVCNRYFVVTVDVEPDCSPTWHYSNPLTFRGVSIGIKEILQPLFNKHGIVPTYLINNVVLEDEKSVSVFKNLDGKFELGTHLHPEFLEPEKSIFNYAGCKAEANCCFYPEDIEFEKIRNITLLFENQFGYRPLSFRAGRFSAGNNTFKSLTRLGYKVDTSLTPHIEWNDKTRENAVDYTNMPEQPFWIHENLLEVPVTIVNSLHFSWLELLKSGFGIRRKPFFKRPLWLRPGFSNISKMKYMSKTMLDKYYNGSSVVLNMMFHNVEVIPKLSPNVQTEQDSINYMETLKQFIEHCIENQFSFVPLSKLPEIYDLQ
jgi:hypothetical protein